MSTLTSLAVLLAVLFFGTALLLLAVYVLFFVFLLAYVVGILVFVVVVGIGGLVAMGVMLALQELGARCSDGLAWLRRKLGGRS